jgi:type IV pilus assembly protein PilA
MTTTQSLKSQKGFTLIELLVVIGILAILLAIVLIAINPARQFAQANNTKRSSDVQTLLNAIHQYAADNGGNPPPGLTAGMSYVMLSSAGLGANAATFCNQIIPRYIAALPQDPGSNNGANITNCAAYDTGYRISISLTDNRTTIEAIGAQLSASISATR